MGIIPGIIIYFAFFAATVSASQSIAVVSNEFAEAYSNPWHGSEVSLFLEEGEVIDIADYRDGWIEFYSETGLSYIPIENVTIIQADALISKHEAMLLIEPTPFAPVIHMASMGTVLNAIGYYGDYYAVDLQGQTCYVYKNDILGGLLDYLTEYGPTPYVINLDMGNSYNYDYSNAHQITLAAPDDYLTVVNTTEGLNLRTYPDPDAPVIECIPNGNDLEIVSLGGEWHYVTYYGASGYVSAKYTQYSGDKLGGSYGAYDMFAMQDSGLASQLISNAKQYIGTKYKWGGTSSSGFDCSGFVYTVYKHAGITLNRSSRDQLKNGTTVSRSELRPGDLVFFATGGGSRISHVGIYIGNNEFIHSSSSGKRGVVISSLDESYYNRTYTNACRVLS